MKSLDNIFRKVDEIFVEVDEFFAHLDDMPTSSAQTKPTTVHTHHVDFNAKTKYERVKLFCRFIRMAFAILLRGKTHISFKNRSKI